MKQISLFIVGILFASSSAAIENDMVVKRFKKIVTSYPKLVDAKKPVISAPSVSPLWFRRKLQIKEIGYDVRKTDSLVSPFAGEISYICGVRGRDGATEQEVKEGADNFEIEKKCRAAYAFQSSRWVIKSVVCQSDDKSTWDTPREGTVYDNCAKLLPQE